MSLAHRGIKTSEFLLHLSFLILLAAWVGILSGIASAVFLISLDGVTTLRESHPQVIALLPLAGLATGWLYHHYGKSVEGGNSLLVDEIHEPRVAIPLRMAPLVFVGTLATHLFGGSSGREGTAIQMAGSLADQVNRILRLSPDNRRILIMAGISGGFSSVFGTPLAGWVFGLEMLRLGKPGSQLRMQAILPCLAAAWIGNQVTLMMGVRHTVYLVSEIPAFSAVGLLSAVLAGGVFGGVGRLFVSATHHVTQFFKTRIAYAPFRPLTGGCLIAASVWCLGTTRYSGLGIPTIVDSFQFLLPARDFALKFGLTVLTLGSGFKGGEVTPLFFIGATLGNALSMLLPLSFSVLAAMGFVGVFAGAAKSPVATTLMAIELFGIRVGVLAGIACFSSSLVSGPFGLYRRTERAP